MSLTALGFLLLYFGGLVLAFVKRPVFGLYAYLLTIYFHPPNQWWGKFLPDIRWSFIAAFVTLIAILIKRENRDQSWFKYPETKIFAVFVIYVSVQSFWALNLQLHLDYVFLSIKFLLLIFMIQKTLTNTDDVVGFIVVNLIGNAYLGYLGLGGGRLENLGIPGLENSNQLAQHMGTVLVFASFLLLCSLGKKKLFLYPLVILVLNGVILTESRSVIIALAVCGIFAVLFAPKKIRTKVYPYLVLGGLAFAILLGPGLMKKMNTITPNSESSVEQDKSAASRLIVIKSQLAMVADSPLVGHGHRGTLLLSPGYVPQDFLTKKTGHRSSHNLTMTLFVDHGIIGAALYLTVISFCLIKIIKLRKLSINNDDAFKLSIILTGLVTSLVFILVAGQGSNNKVLEIDIWLYALIPLVYDMLRAKKMCSQEQPSKRKYNDIQHRVSVAD